MVQFAREVGQEVGVALGQADAQAVLKVLLLTDFLLVSIGYAETLIQVYMIPHQRLCVLPPQRH